MKNALLSAKVNSIFLIYVENGTRRKFPVKLNFMDTKECYLSTELPVNYQKPKKKTSAEIKAYNPDGVYSASVKILDANMSGSNIIYVTELPKKWIYTQLRMSTRKDFKVPFKVKFNDGYEFSAESYDLALGGVSFYTERPIPDLYTKISGIISFDLPKESEPLHIEAETRYLREHKNKNNPNDSRYVYKFMGMQNATMIALKNFLLYLD